MTLSLLPEIVELREELSKVVVLSRVVAFVNEASMIGTVPLIINKPLVGPITPLEFGVEMLAEANIQQ